VNEVLMRRIPEQLMLTVLCTKDLTACKRVTIVDHRLIATLARPISFSANQAVMINYANTSVLGEVVGSWYENAAVFAAIELKQSWVKADARWMMDSVGDLNALAEQIRLRQFRCNESMESLAESAAPLDVRRAIKTSVSVTGESRG